MLSEMSQSQKANTVLFCEYEVHRMARFIEPGSEMEDARGRGCGLSVQQRFNLGR